MRVWGVGGEGRKGYGAFLLSRQNPTMSRAKPDLQYLHQYCIREFSGLSPAGQI